jgi:hypothetical protein|nr:MAG TPA: hypothetical protein [Caudoviricetes sp.]
MGSQNIIKTMEEEITRLQKELDKAHSERKVSQNEFLVCGNTMKIDILGTEYRIEIHKVSEDSYMEEKGLAGYCEEENKLIVVADMSEEKYFVGMDEKAQEIYRKKTLRHEIMHAFLNESGLSDSSNRFDGAWAKNEEMVDWLAIQAPKIFSTFNKMNIL